jgi:hypothetical protein
MTSEQHEPQSEHRRWMCVCVCSSREPMVFEYHVRRRHTQRERERGLLIHVTSSALSTFGSSTASAPVTSKHACCHALISNMCMHAHIHTRMCCQLGAAHIDTTATQCAAMGTQGEQGRAGRAVRSDQCALSNEHAPLVAAALTSSAPHCVCKPLTLSQQQTADPAFSCMRHLPSPPPPSAAGRSAISVRPAQQPQPQPSPTLAWFTHIRDREPRPPQPDGGLAGWMAAWLERVHRTG